jgi:hypothetical protein
MKTVAQLKYSVAGLLSGVDINNVDDVYGCFERAASTMIQKADMPEASGIQNIVLYSGVTDYLCDTRIYGTAINDIRPQGISRNASDFVTKVNQQDFDRTKGIGYPSGTMSTFQYNNGTPIIRIVAPFPKQRVVLDPMTSITGWVAAGSASALTQDTTDFYQSPASMRFTLTSASAGTLTKTINAIDISSYENVGVAFLAVKIPTGATATDLTNLILKVGSDSGNYDSITSTTGFLGSWVSGEWLIVAFDFSGASSTGTPDWSAITYLQVTATHGATLTNFKIGGLWISQPSPAQILYQSSAIFLAVASTATTTSITADTDTIILTNPSYNIYQFECALAILQNTGAGASDNTSVKINQILHGTGNDLGLYAMYRGDNPSQEIRTTGSWYENEQGYGGSYPSNY